MENYYPLLCYSLITHDFEMNHQDFQKPLACFFSLSLLIRSRHQHQLKETREHSRAGAQYINRLFYPTVVTMGLWCLNTKAFRVQYVNLFFSSKTNIQLYEHLQIKERDKHSASCEFFFPTSKQEVVWVHIPINNSMTVQTHITSLNNPTTVHTYTIRYTVTQEQVNSLLQ